MKRASKPAGRGIAEWSASCLFLLLVFASSRVWAVGPVFEFHTPASVDDPAAAAELTAWWVDRLVRLINEVVAQAFALLQREERGDEAFRAVETSPQEVADAPVAIKEGAEMRDC